MNPEEVYVVMDAKEIKILSVHPDKELAERGLNRQKDCSPNADYKVLDLAEAIEWVEFNMTWTRH